MLRDTKQHRALSITAEKEGKEGQVKEGREEREGRKEGKHSDRGEGGKKAKNFSLNYVAENKQIWTYMNL